MKRINLPKILESLMLNVHEIKIDQDILEKARLPIERMLNNGK
jgi:quinolinate synthase